jgi:hypothetical protein
LDDGTRRLIESGGEKTGVGPDERHTKGFGCGDP